MIDVSDYKSIEAPIRFFEEISKIPRGSGNTRGIADYLEGFAAEHGFFCVRDELDNVIIRKPATQGYEGKRGIIFQGHTDMVAEKALNVNIDMKKEGLRLYRDGDFLRADGTTLGGDDGVAVAFALALLDSKDIKHPEFEAVFTTDEEVGLTGATGIDLSVLHGRLLINIDSDVEGIFTVGCAGGVRAYITLPITRETFSSGIYRLSVSGLLGGHSGCEIDKGRTNAIKYLSHLLTLIPGARLISLSGGNADNAIPRDAEAIFTLDKENYHAALEKIGKETANLRLTENAACCSLTEADCEDAPLDAASTAAVLSLIEKEPCGVIAMSEDIKELVETSLNLGIVRLDTDALQLAFSIRSSVGEKKQALCSRVADIARQHGASIEWRCDYPAWEYRKESYLRDKMCEVFLDMYGKAPRVVTIHAGLECGILTSKLPELDCVSIGPDNFDIHTPNERLSLSSTARVWEYLIELLQRI